VEKLQNKHFVGFVFTTRDAHVILFNVGDKNKTIKNLYGSIIKDVVSSAIAYPFIYFGTESGQVKVGQLE